MRINTKWSRASRLTQELNAHTEGTVIVKRIPTGFFIQVKQHGEVVGFKANKYVTFEKAKRLLREAQLTA